MTLLSQIMNEKPFFDANEDQIAYRLQQLASDLKDFPYLAIWLGLNDLRVDSLDKNFPTTAAIIKAVRYWSDYIVDAFQFFAYSQEEAT